MVLVTGADGFLGTHVVRELVRAGYQVRGFVERSRPAKSLRGLPVDLAYGQIYSDEDVLAAVRGCAYVVHSAGSTRTWPNRSPDLHRVNVEGTACVVRAALRAGVRRVVHVGSASSFGAGGKAAPGTEDAPFANRRLGSGYVDSKYGAHRVVLDAVRDQGLPAVIVAPTFMLGPHDSAPGSGRIILELHAGRIPAIPPGGKNFVHVRDVAICVVAALDRARRPCYIAGNQNLSYAELFGLIAETTGCRPPRFAAPSAVVKTVGLVGSMTSWVTGVEPGLTLAMARFSCGEHYYAADHAIRDLGLPQTPVREAIAEAFEWFCRNGYVANADRGTALAADALQ